MAGTIAGMLAVMVLEEREVNAAERKRKASLDATDLNREIQVRSAEMSPRIAVHDTPRNGGAQVVSWMSEFDKNKSRNLNRAEIKALLEAKCGVEGASVPPEVLDWVMDEDAIEREGDGEPAVPRERVLSALKKYTSFLSQKQYVRDLFVRHDLDKTGKLDGQELVKLLREVAPPPHKHADLGDALYVISKCDKDGDGRISHSELAVAISTWIDVSRDTEPPKKKSSFCALL